MQSEENENSNDYLIFKLNDEIFGAPLLDIREVAEFQKPRPVPNSAKHFSGVINIRGEILSVIDLRKKYNYEAVFDRTTVFLVFDIPGGSVACVVDSLMSVQEFEPQNIDTGVHLSKNFDANCFIGIAKMKDQLVTLINLKKVLESDQVVRSSHNLLAA